MSSHFFVLFCGLFLVCQFVLFVFVLLLLLLLFCFDMFFTMLNFIRCGIIQKKEKKETDVFISTLFRFYVFLLCSSKKKCAFSYSFPRGIKCDALYTFYVDNKGDNNYMFSIKIRSIKHKVLFKRTVTIQVIKKSCSS